MSDIEKRLNNIEAHIGINQTITRDCRALDWLDESLLRTCYTVDAYIDYGSIMVMSKFILLLWS